MSELDKEINNENMEDIEVLKSGSKTEAETEPSAEAKSEAETEPSAEAKSEAEAEPSAEAKSNVEMNSDNKTYTESGTNVDVSQKAEVESSAESGVETISNTAVEPEADVEDEACDENHSEQDKRKKLLRLRKVIRYSMIVLLAACTLVMAVIAGAYMAATSNGKNTHDLVTILNGTYVEENTQIQLAKLESDSTISVTNTVLASNEVNNESENNEIYENVAQMDELAVKEAESSTTDMDSSIEGDSKSGRLNTIEDSSSIESQDTVDAEDIQSEILGVDEINEVLDASSEQMVMPDHPIAYPDPDALYPLPYTASGIDYFNDALFIGDSRMEGFGMYSGVPATFYAATGFQLHKFETMKVVRTDHGKVPIFDAIPYDAFTKIYIKVGLNEMGCGSEAQFEAKYSELIARLRECEPRAIIYVHGILPVTAEKNASDATHNNANVMTRNEALKAFAVSQKAYYLDVASAFANEEGCLPSEMTGDGIHLKAPYMSIWRDYLMNNTVVR